MADRAEAQQAPAPSSGDEQGAATSQTTASQGSASQGTSDGKPPLPTLSLPKGGGAIRDIGEKFTVNAATGTAGVTVPIATSAGRHGFGPSLSLAYDSGAGNGPFGLGWKVELPAITRKTDKRLPRYEDGPDQDAFILSAAEDLVPVREEVDGAWVQVPQYRSVGGRRFEIQRYRPRVESLFARIERWRDVRSGESHWRSISSDNVTTLYGATAASRIADPADPVRVFSWLVCEKFDDLGNAVVYDYVSEDSAGVATDLPSERNRTDESRSANRYVKRIRYGNRAPWPTGAEAEEHGISARRAEATESDWMFEVVFDYGDHDESVPRPEPSRMWPCRPDPFSSYRAGFEVRTYRRCHRVLMFHHFPDVAEVGAGCLVSSTDLGYADTGGSGLTTVASVTHTGYRRHGGGYRSASLPPLELTYSRPVVGDEVRQPDPQVLSELPIGVDEAAYQWVDLDGEGLSGVLARQGGAWQYRHNLGDGRFAPPLTLATQPAAIGPSGPTGTTGPSGAMPARSRGSRRPDGSGGSGGRQELLDLSGDGHLDLAELGGPMAGYYQRGSGEGWHRFRPFASQPNISWDDPDLRMLDLDGDGLADVLITGDDAFTWYPSWGLEGFGPGQRADTVDPFTEERGPRLLLSDPEQSIYLGDMTGDGLTDLIRVRDGEVSYWPNLGYGRFGAKVTMDSSPRLDRPGLFDQRRVRLADTDGTGAVDLVYLGGDGVRVYLNRSGNGYAPPRLLPQAFPRLDSLAHVMVADLLGHGTGCLVWSSPLPGDAGRQLRYVDLMTAGKPYLLTGIVNNLGAETTIGYASSTKFYLADRAAGRPWLTRLPFPVHVVERVEVIDRVNRNRFITRHAYHDGYFDGFEREFRGFGMVEQWDTEELAILESQTSGTFANEDTATGLPPVLKRTWLHTGVFPDADQISRHYAHQYWRQPGGGDPDLPDTTLPTTLRQTHRPARPWRLSPTEAREACRALKGRPLREETYALDGTDAAGRPYLVTEHNYTIELLQPALTPIPDGPQNYHAVLLTHARESITAHYERALYPTPHGESRSDPRIIHDVVLAIDDFGNPLRSASAAYGRVCSDPGLDPQDRLAQRRSRLTYTDNEYTNAVDLPAAHRTPMPARKRTFEVVGLHPRGRLSTFAELRDGLAAITTELPFQDWDAGSDDLPQPARRLIGHTQARYRRDDLSEPLPFGVVESMALPYEHYRLAFPDGLVEQVYGSRVDDEMLKDQCGYVEIAEDPGWWAPSGRVFYSPGEHDDTATEYAFAKRHFFTPHRFRSPFGDTTTVTYDDHVLLGRETRDALGNRVTAGERDERDRFVADGNDYRVLQPRLVMDANRNRATVAFDALGMVVGTAVMGKPEEDLGDSLEGFEPDLDGAAVAAYGADPLGEGPALIGEATSRLVYDVHAYRRGRDQGEYLPAYVGTIARERHVSDLAGDESSRLHTAISYSDGFGREVQKKVQAEGNLPAAGERPGDRQWTGTGWTVFDNKGNAVRRYEPFFTATHEFEHARVEGVSTVLYHDPVGRVVGTLHPNRTFEKVVFEPWSQATWDTNDTVLLDPRTDPDVEAFFSRVLAAQPDWQTWYTLRINGDRGEDEKVAAQRARVHAGTPTVAWFDPLAHAIATTAHNRFERDGAPVDEYLTTRTARDVQDHQRSIVDQLGRVTSRFDYDLLDKPVRQADFEAGTRLVLPDVGGSTILVWNSRGFRLRHTYDQLRRAVGEYAAEADGTERLVQYTVYGETVPDAETHNLRGRNHLQFDGAGTVVHPRFDFKGNLLESRRRVTRDYRGVPGWDAVEESVRTAGQLDLDGPLAALLDELLEPETFTGTTAYDAHNRPTRVTAPDGTVTELRYNNATLLDRVDVVQPGGDRTTYVSDIEYNARGERIDISHGNDTRTHFELDPETFRVIRQVTRRPDGALQDYRHTFDPVGNVVIIRDHAQLTVFHNNAVVSPDTSYVYDALYQLRSAQGREHIGQTTDHDGRPRSGGGSEHPHDRQAMRRYTEHYRYDAAGNMLELSHSAPGGGWTRRSFYQETSELDPEQSNNRLSRSTVGDTTWRFTYDRNGNTTSMPHLPEMGWDYGDQFVFSELGGGGRAFYSYDTAGRRVRKTIEDQNGNRVAERIYVGAFETYRRFDVAGDSSVSLERNTVHIYDNENRVALIETTSKGTRESADTTTDVRYQLTSGSKSVTIETDRAGDVITYEEFHPYGTTSYLLARGFAEVSRKRYRYAGKERDEETGFYYYGARYYDPALARWTSCDPAGLVDGANAYRYVKNNPVNFTDPTGQWSLPSWRTVAVVAAVVVVGTVVTVATAGAAGPLVVGAVASVGLTGTAATVATGVAVGAIAGAVGGAAAGAAGEATRQTVNSKALGLGNEEFSGTKIVNAAVKEGKTGALIGAAVGGAAALAATTTGAAALGAVGKLAQRVAPNLSKAAVAAGRGVAGAVGAVAKKSGLTALAEASEKLGFAGAKSLFKEGTRGAAAVADLAETASIAQTFERAALRRNLSRATEAEIEAAVGAEAKAGPHFRIGSRGDLLSGSSGKTPEGYYQDALRFPASSTAAGAAPGAPPVTTEFRVHSPAPAAVAQHPGSNAATGNTVIIGQGNRRMLPSGQWTTKAQRMADQALANETHIPIHRD